MDNFADDPLVQAITTYVQSYMQNYDASHDWSHIQRVLGLARYIYSKSENQAELDLRVIHLAALLHDVGDKKYVPLSLVSVLNTGGTQAQKPPTPRPQQLASPPAQPRSTETHLPTHDNPPNSALHLPLPPPLTNLPPRYLPPNTTSTTQIASLLTAHGAPPALAQRVQTICLGVSYSSEAADPARVAALVAAHPELAVVQDADRLDALGAIGLGRMFTFGGAKTGRPMDESMEHVDDKLLRLGGMAKTAVGRDLARERSERLEVFKKWWAEERGFAGWEGGRAST
jgi:HD superfamily phosphodiesterase